MNFLKTYLLGALALTFVCTSCESTIDPEAITNTELTPDNLGKKSTPKIPVWAGGTIKFETFSSAKNSQKFRDRGGKLYVHNIAWVQKLGKGKKATTRKNNILKHFGNKGLFHEVGYTGADTGPKSWPNTYKKVYGKNKYWKPFAITANIFAKGRKPLFKNWKIFSKEMKNASGVKNIYPTWEYQNLKYNRTNTKNLREGYLGKNKNLRSIVKDAKGITFDVPPNFFFGNQVGHEYRAYVKNTIKWIKNKKNCENCKVYFIVSAHNGKNSFSKDCLKMYEHMKKNNILPDGFLVNNYTKGNAGPESEKNSALHAALNLMNVIGEK